MQETKEFKARDGKRVYVEVNSARGNKAAVLCIHGFTSSNRTHMWFNAAQQWPRKGFDTWRVALYPGGQGRQMRTLRWAHNMADLRQVLRAMRREYKRIFLVGHSLGGTMAVELADERIAGVVLWDPPHARGLEETIGGELNPRFYTLDWGCTMLVNKRYAREVKDSTFYRGSFARVPTLLVRASNNDEGWDFEKVPAVLAVIKDSDHSFNKEGNERELFRVTLGFMRRGS